MPRLLSSLLRHAHHIHPLLPPLLRSCRDLTSARNELRWLREQVTSLSNAAGSRSARYDTRQTLRQLVYSRASGRPLQYILGSQPFGDLDILCRPGVLIPRPETESLAAYLATLLPKLSNIRGQLHQHLRILDLCTGTGCIPLLLHNLLSSQGDAIKLCGVDVSLNATTLARRNLQHNISLGRLRPNAQQQICFDQDNIFEDSAKGWRISRWDIVISNPPYISPDSFDKTTSRSVRNFEPRIALVPRPGPITPNTPKLDHEIGDMFYPRLLRIAHQVSSQVLLMEVADLAQARRVAGLVIESGAWSDCEIWRDLPAQGESNRHQYVKIAGRDIRVRGEGLGRAVIAWRDDGRQQERKEYSESQ